MVRSDACAVETVVNLLSRTGCYCNLLRAGVPLAFGYFVLVVVVVVKRGKMM